MSDSTASRFAAVIAQQRQTQALNSAKQVIDTHTQWVLSHLSVADRELIASVTGEKITDATDSASMFALTLAQSRITKQVAQTNVAATMFNQRPQIKTQHDRVATFTSMRAMMGSNAVGRSLDLEA